MLVSPSMAAHACNASSRGGGRKMRTSRLASATWQSQDQPKLFEIYFSSNNTTTTKMKLLVQWIMEWCHQTHANRGRGTEDQTAWAGPESARTSRTRGSGFNFRSHWAAVSLNQAVSSLRSTVPHVGIWVTSHSHSVGKNAKQLRGCLWRSFISHNVHCEWSWYKGHHGHVLGLISLRCLACPERGPLYLTRTWENSKVVSLMAFLDSSLGISLLVLPLKQWNLQQFVMVSDHQWTIFENKEETQ